MSRLFGTDGVRGIANKELTPILAFELGRAAARLLKKSGTRPLFLIGKDTRISGDMLESALSAGVFSAGGEVLCLGVIPTPAVACLVKEFGADAGVVISASHNTYEYNGIKFFRSDGFKLDDDIEDAIEEMVTGEKDEKDVTGADVGKYSRTGSDFGKIYVDHLINSVSADISGKRIVLDCANGAAYRVAKEAYEALGARVSLIGDEPDGTNINEKCGSTHPEGLQKKVVDEGAFMGMAFDGDADRLIAVDEKGRLIDGDKTICICAEMLHKKGKLAGDLVTGTVMSNLGFHKYLESIGCRTQVTNVGDRYVLEKMRETGSSLGGEQSGHIIFSEYSTTGDGILSSLQVLSAIIEKGMLPSEVSDGVELFPQVLKNAAVKNENKAAFKEDDEIKKAIDKAEEKLKGNGRILIRPSGTEPCVRVMIEGPDTVEIERMAVELADKIGKKFG